MCRPRVAAFSKVTDTSQCLHWRPRPLGVGLSRRRRICLNSYLDSSDRRVIRGVVLAVLFLLTVMSLMRASRGIERCLGNRVFLRPVLDWDRLTVVELGSVSVTGT